MPKLTSNKATAVIVSSFAASVYLFISLLHYAQIIKTYADSEESNELLADILNGVPSFIEGLIFTHVTYKLVGEMSENVE